MFSFPWTSPSSIVHYLHQIPWLSTLDDCHLTYSCVQWLSCFSIWCQHIYDLSYSLRYGIPASACLVERGRGLSNLSHLFFRLEWRWYRWPQWRSRKTRLSQGPWCWCSLAFTNISLPARRHGIRYVLNLFSCLLYRLTYFTQFKLSWHWPPIWNNRGLGQSSQGCSWAWNEACVGI